MVAFAQLVLTSAMLPPPPHTHTLPCAFPHVNKHRPASVHSYIQCRTHMPAWLLLDHNVLPTPKTRVSLARVDDDFTTEYINANFIRGFFHGREFIGTQGPLEATVPDFWSVCVCATPL